MKRFQLVGLCLVAVFALTAAMAASASAQVPTWYECAKAGKETVEWKEGTKTKKKSVVTGAWENKECSKEDTTDVYRIKGSNPGPEGKYELKEGIGKGKEFKGKGQLFKVKHGSEEAEEAIVLHVKTWLGDEKIECAKATDSGHLELPNREKDVSVDYSKCKALETKTCESAGAKSGEIKITGLKGELGYIEESPTVVGLKLESEANPGVNGELVKFTCEGKDLEGTITGGIIGVQEKDVNVISKESSVVDIPGEYIGHHEYEGKPYTPIVNIPGWASEQAEIAQEVKEDEEGTLGHKIEREILKGVFCGEFVQELLGKECTPEAYTGLEGTTVNKGEALMIKA